MLTRVLTVKQLASFRAGCDGHRGPFVFDVKLTVRIACKTTRPLERSVGGSSGGAAAAVAAASSQRPREATARLDPLPASCCGLFGLKPTRARTPLGPLVGESWDSMGVDHVLTRSVRGSAALLDANHGPAPGDPNAARVMRRP